MQFKNTQFSVWPPNKNEPPNPCQDLGGGSKGWSIRALYAEGPGSLPSTVGPPECHQKQPQAPRE